MQHKGLEYRLQSEFREWWTVLEMGRSLPVLVVRVGT